MRPRANNFKHEEAVHSEILTHFLSQEDDCYVPKVHEELKAPPKDTLTPTVAFDPANNIFSPAPIEGNKLPKEFIGFHPRILIEASWEFPPGEAPSEPTVSQVPELPLIRQSLELHVVIRDPLVVVHAQDWCNVAVHQTMETHEDFAF